MHLIVLGDKPIVPQACPLVAQQHGKTISFLDTGMIYTKIQHNFILLSEVEQANLRDTLQHNLSVVG